MWDSKVKIPDKINTKNKFEALVDEVENNQNGNLEIINIYTKQWVEDIVKYNAQQKNLDEHEGNVREMKDCMKDLEDSTKEGNNTNIVVWLGDVLKDNEQVVYDM